MYINKLFGVRNSVPDHSVVDPDPHPDAEIRNQDPNPHRDPHQSDKLDPEPDPDPHQLAYDMPSTFSRV
jgi:hypothetical protein